MSSADYQRRRAAWKQRQAEWLADNPCVECGSTVGQKTLWKGPKETQPLRSMSEVFKLSARRREELLPQCYTLCYEHWRIALKRNGHGGGKTGISTCECDACVKVRREYYNGQGRIQTARLRERRAKLIEMGLSATGVGWDNKWNNSEKGKRHKAHKRAQFKNEWLKGRNCTKCGTDKDLVPVWRKYPGPIKSTGSIWSYGQPTRDELLKNCHTLCVSCSRYDAKQRKREKSQ